MHGVVPPIVINLTPLNNTGAMANNHWGAAIGPLALGAIHNLPKGAKDHLPKFSGDGKVTTTEHLNSFKVACGVLAV